MVDRHGVDQMIGGSRQETGVSTLDGFSIVQTIHRLTNSMKVKAGGVQSPAFGGTEGFVHGWSKLVSLWRIHNSVQIYGGKKWPKVGAGLH
jgi:hypothetical protein